MTRGSNSGTHKMEGTTTHSPKLDSLEMRAMAVLQQNWQSGRGLGKCRGEIGRSRELTGDLLLRGTFTFPIKTILKSSVPPLPLWPLRVHTNNEGCAH